MKKRTARCSVPDCDSPAKTRGWCDKHYHRWRAHGDPLIALKPHRHLEIGQRVGLLTIVDRVKRGPGKWHYKAICACGNVRYAHASTFLRIETPSCGKCVRHARTTHGHCRGYKRHPLYATWHMMKTRCLNPRNASYRDYGGRGIKVSGRWLGRNGFPNFLADMGEKPTPKHTLDRIDNDGPYSPENCRWATMSEQTLNRRHRNQWGGPYRDALREIIARCDGLAVEIAQRALREP